MYGLPPICEAIERRRRGHDWCPRRLSGVQGIGRRLLLTSEGEQLLNGCRGLVNYARALREQADVLRRGDVGVLRVSASPAGLLVVPHHRRRGIGALLVAAAERQASALGVRSLHLYTPASEGFYERLGWSVIDRMALPSGSVSVMHKRVAGP